MNKLLSAGIAGSLFAGSLFAGSLFCFNLVAFLACSTGLLITRNMIAIPFSLDK
jgi:hypothetical protein